jgi:hypothetical protein
MFSTRVYFYDYACLLIISYYCNGLIECPTMSSPFLIRQQAHFFSTQTCACSCLQMEHLQASSRCSSLLTALALILFWFFSCFDLSSIYNHNKIKGIPIAKNTTIVRTGTRITNSNIPKHNVPIPRVESHLVVKLSIQ